MKRLHEERDLEAQIDYHLADGRAPIFEEGQPERIRRARRMLDDALATAPSPATIWELGCGSADISGPKSFLHDVYGCDVTKEAMRVVAARFPMMHFIPAQLENLTPQACDALVLCELLEHVDDPLGLVRKWMPHAKTVVIGHPIAPPGTDPEEGHIWSYDLEDFNDWFVQGGHTLQEVQTFAMPAYDKMVIGWGKRKW